MDHVRIDEGIKRGKRQKVITRRSPIGQFLPVLPRDPETIRKVLEAYAAGATLKQIAKQYSVSREAIYAWTLGKLAPAEHETLVRRCLTARIAKADRILEESPEPVNVTRGERMARFARLDYERLRPDLYGEQSSLLIVHDFSDSLRAISERKQARLIEGEVVVDQPQSEPDSV